ncbi:MAG: polysaccharide deacetylase family protein [Clostridia bacterium]|nr:polysaccharide deacetylase family protein [Clostridia bacterium]MDY6183902.1 polysaccharide deacetylase family protein [Eubacteriales bacterium]
MLKLFSAVLAVLTLISPVKRPQESCSHWYIRHTGDHTQPTADPRFSYLDSYKAFYVDKKSNEENKVIYLTFDAGYENGNVERILDTLKQENVPAAFFILQNLVYKNPDLLRRMTEEGHLVCNHTAHHKDMSQANKEEFQNELREMENVYREGCGKEIAKFYRPPEGNFVEENLAWAEEMGYVTVFWSFAYADWDNAKQPDPVRAKKKILDNSHPGEILLLHPTSKTNADILGDLIAAWKADGYRFGSLDELCK